FVLVVSFFIKSNHIDEITLNARIANTDARLLTEPIQFGEVSARLPIGFFLALVCAFALWFFLTKTKQGFEMTAVGKSPKAAQYAGIKIGRTVIAAMAISGALGGLAGVTHYLASVPSIAPGSLPSAGFDAIAVAFLGNVHPLGAVLAASLIATLSSGAAYMSSTVGVRHEISALITGMILLFAACGGYIRAKLNDKKRQYADRDTCTNIAANTGIDADAATGATAGADTAANPPRDTVASAAKTNAGATSNSDTTAKARTHDLRGGGSA
ncbi:MAG: hypothetical protein FWD93_04505, partial [Coriobacteriia bacterium]|nr:hypothetical protein [Coriobacteriia bacterium]